MNKFKLPGIPFAITDLFDAGIQIGLEEKEEKRKKMEGGRFPLSPSQFGGCGRELAINLAEFTGLQLYPREMLQPRATKKFSRGHNIEYSLLRQMGWSIPHITQAAKQQLIPMAMTPDGKYQIGGSLDAVFSTEEGHMIVDIKSKGTFYSAVYSDKFREEFEEISEMEGVIQIGRDSYFIEDIDSFYMDYPKESFNGRYFLQLNAYGASDWGQNYVDNRFPGLKGMDACSLYFENKNTHHDAEIRWKPSRKLYDFAIKRMQDIYQWVVIDKKPAHEYPADYTLGTLMCKLCSRNQTCWPGEKHPYTGIRTKFAKDTSHMDNGEGLEKKYSELKGVVKAAGEAELIKKELIVMMENEKVFKVKFSDGHIYEIKTLKTPKPHNELRRGK